MERFDTHVCLVSEQAMPSLLPVLDDRWRPRRVVLAVSSRMAGKAASLKAVIKRRCAGTLVEEVHLPDAYNFRELSETFLEFLAQPGNDRAALNVTGGTKMMAVAAQEVFRSDKRHVFYVNVDTDEIIVIGQEGRSAPLAVDVKVRDLLEAQGFTVESEHRPQVRSDERDACARIIDHVKTDGRGLGILNRLAASDDAKQRLRVTLSDRDRDSQSLNRMIDLFQDSGHLKLAGHQLSFPNADSRQFVNGGWLELHVYQVLQDLRGKNKAITDVVLGAKIIHPDGRTCNELDIVCLHRNSLHIVECKTANLSQEGRGGDDKATEAIYKSEALTKMGGLRTKAMIVDYRGALSEEKANADRATAAGIVVAAAEQLRDLSGLFSRVWFSRPA
jgi:hypothetical protein